LTPIDPPPAPAEWSDDQPRPHLRQGCLSWPHGFLVTEPATPPPSLIRSELRQTLLLSVGRQASRGRDWKRNDLWLEIRSPYRGGYPRQGSWVCPFRARVCSFCGTNSKCRRDRWL